MYEYHQTERNWDLGSVDSRGEAGMRANGGSRHPERPVPRHSGFAKGILGSRLVPRREIRHLGALGSTVRPGAGRLVSPQYVYRRQWPIQMAPAELQTPVQGRFKG